MEDPNMELRGSWGRPITLYWLPAPGIPDPTIGSNSKSYFQKKSESFFLKEIPIVVLTSWIVNTAHLGSRRSAGPDKTKLDSQSKYQVKYDLIPFHYYYMRWFGVRYTANIKWNIKFLIWWPFMIWDDLGRGTCSTGQQRSSFDRRKWGHCGKFD